MPDYGATIDGVKAHLPHRRIEDNTRPSTDDVQRYLETTTRWVTMRVGVLAEGTPGFDHARGAAEIGAAAMAEDASFPERSGRAASSYGEVLWARFQEAIDELLESLGLTGEGGGGPAVAGERPAFNFPDPAWRRSVGL